MATRNPYAPRACGLGERGSRGASVPRSFHACPDGPPLEGRVTGLVYDLRYACWDAYAPSGYGVAADYAAWARRVGALVVRIHNVFDGAGTGGVEILEPRGAAAAALIRPYLDLVDPPPSGSGQGLAPIGARIHVLLPDPVTPALPSGSAPRG